MNILYIWDADYPWDIRVDKICTTLMQHGNEIHIAARNLKKLPENERINNLNVHRLKAYKNDKINFVLSFPFFSNPIWKRFLNNIIKRNKINLVIVRDLPMAITGIMVGKRYNLPVIFDMAENYVAMVKNVWKYRKFKGFNILVRNPYFATIVEKFTLRWMDHILVVVEEAKQYIVSKGIDPHKVTIVGNTPPLGVFRSHSSQTNQLIDQIKNKYSVIYVGGVQMGRGIQLVLQAIPKVIKKIPNFLFVVVGDGYGTNILKNMVNTKNLQEYVLWVGWINHQNIYDYIRASKIGIIPHFVSEHTNSTVPNKLFDYMGFGLPVIASDAAPLKRILEKEKCGLVYESGNAEDLAEKLIFVFNSNTDYSGHGIHAVMNKYNWDLDAKRLLKVISEYNK
jgi:glycosyltransferase involved in cell wall biosynthesis